MVKKEIDEEIEEDYEEDDDDENEESEDDEEPVKKKKGNLKPKDWVIQHSPEAWTVFNPRTKEVIATAPNIELLSLQLQVVSAQKSSEASKQTE